MYKLMAGLSFLIRQYYLPNPFEILGKGIWVELKGEMILLSPTKLNWIAGLLLPIITYEVVSIYYEKGSNAAFGSFLYLVFYCVHIGILALCSLLNFKKWFVLLVLLIYICIHMLCASKIRIRW